MTDSKNPVFDPYSQEPGFVEGEEKGVQQNQQNAVDQSVTVGSIDSGVVQSTLTSTLPQIGGVTPQLVPLGELNQTNTTEPYPVIQQPTPEVVNTSEAKITPAPGSRAWLKLGTFLIIMFIFGTSTTVLITKFFSMNALKLKRSVLISSNFKESLWQTYGAVPEAEFMLPIDTPKGQLEYPFLLDTGAVVSSLPREMAEKMGYDLAQLPRQTFKGFGNTTSFVYQATMKVDLGGKQIELPVVYTEAEGSRALLGRTGLFDKFSIVVDHSNRVVEIRE